MDREVIDQKLESLRRCIKRAREKCPTDLDALVRSFDLQDIITLNLTRAVQLGPITNHQLWAKPGYGEAGIPRGILRRRAPITALKRQLPITVFYEPDDFS